MRRKGGGNRTMFVCAILDAQRRSLVVVVESDQCLLATPLAPDRGGRTSSPTKRRPPPFPATCSVSPPPRRPSFPLQNVVGGRGRSLNNFMYDIGFCTCPAGRFAKRTQRWGHRRAAGKSVFQCCYRWEVLSEKRMKIVDKFRLSTQLREVTCIIYLAVL